MTLESTYECVPGAALCPNPNPTPDSASCASRTGFTALRLP